MNRPASSALIDIDDLKEIANGHILSICHEILPNGRENCGYWETSSIADVKTGKYSLKVNLKGATRGLWRDFAVSKSSPEGRGNVIQLVAVNRFGGNVGHALQWLRSFLGLDNLDPSRLATEKAKAKKASSEAAAKAAESNERKRRRALQLYLAAEPIPGTPAEIYLCSRSIDLRGAGLTAPGSIKFMAEVYCAETDPVKLPAMIGAVVNLEGRHIATHRTYLQPSGAGKATLFEAKKVLGKFQGGFIPLWKGTQDCSLADLKPGTPIYVSEGIEDGLSVALADPSLRIIAGISLSNIGGLELPAKCPVHILGQRDENLKTIEQFEHSVARLQEAGHEVFLHWPPAGVKDYNDVLRDAATGGKINGK